jgi:hypothetical protein
VRTSPRRRQGWILAFVSGVALGALVWRPAPLRAGSARANCSREGALDELERARLVQALIRAESTAVLLEQLAAAPSDSEGRP